MARHHAVAAGHPQAAQAGLAVLEAGGNAIDAGVAVGLATGVLESQLVGIAGIAPILIHLAAERRVVAVSGVGGWPQAASAELFRDRHGGVIDGVLSTVVPGGVDGWLTSLEAFGTMTFAEVAAPAIALAREGFPMYPLMAR
jgi:gamma-glutamyltranspeptidase / glutathione hydrolase